MMGSFNLTNDVYYLKFNQTKESRLIEQSIQNMQFYVARMGEKCNYRRICIKTVIQLKLMSNFG